jgi:peptide subunit release factor 1 (eRF1)
VLRAKLPRPLQARFAGRLPLAADASEPVVVQAIRHAAEAVERRGEVELVDRLRDASNTPNAVLGFDATLGALSDDRVSHLVLADTLSGWATQCTTCRRLVSGPGPCTGCGSRTAPVLDARETIVRRARSRGASVETISGEAATLLLTHGGLGAWTRY